MAAEYEIVEVVDISTEDVCGCDFSFVVASRVAPPFDHILDSQLRVTGIEQPYRKHYDADFDSISSPADDESKQFFAAVKTGGRVRGYIHVREMWNKMACLEDIAIDRSLRGKGIGKALIHRALEWTKTAGLYALRAETQDNNVAACNLYQSCGFKFGGFDSYLYAANQKLQHETALFWYRILDT
jgi:streptothricin acetyltransferase